jgi:hypothetical protein
MYSPETALNGRVEQQRYGASPASGRGQGGRASGQRARDSQASMAQPATDGAGVGQHGVKSAKDLDRYVYSSLSLPLLLGLAHGH